MTTTAGPFHYTVNSDDGALLARCTHDHPTEASRDDCPVRDKVSAYAHLIATRQTIWERPSYIEVGEYPPRRSVPTDMFQSLRKAVETLPNRDVVRSAVGRSLRAVARLQSEMGPKVEPHPDRRPLRIWTTEIDGRLSSILDPSISNEDRQRLLAEVAAIAVMALESQTRQHGYLYSPEEV